MNSRHRIAATLAALCILSGTAMPASAQVDGTTDGDDQPAAMKELLDYEKYGNKVQRVAGNQIYLKKSTCRPIVITDHDAFLASLTPSEKQLRTRAVKLIRTNADRAVTDPSTPPIEIVPSHCGAKPPR